MCRALCLFEPRLKGSQCKDIEQFLHAELLSAVDVLSCNRLCICEQNIKYSCVFSYVTSSCLSDNPCKTTRPMSRDSGGDLV